ncbi:SRPBCC domain-containing protein [Uliginosibacterium sp. sgz301328]|uniref:SRPBCC domain-containing protein n=1 Tax=Uliginosibacterium sp. sgz301328 TaxID=3243764 RepID=UPI00359D30DF
MSAQQTTHEAITLTCVREFDAPRRLVFETWATPEHQRHWRAPVGQTVLSFDADFRPGGAYRMRMRSAAGVERSLSGVYRDIIEPELISFTFAWEGDSAPANLVTVTFEAIGTRTRLTLRQTPFVTVEARDAHAVGWGSAFDRLAEHLTTRKHS